MYFFSDLSYSNQRLFNKNDTPFIPPSFPLLMSLTTGEAIHALALQPVESFDLAFFQSPVGLMSSDTGRKSQLDLYTPSTEVDGDFVGALVPQLPKSVQITRWDDSRSEIYCYIFLFHFLFFSYVEVSECVYLDPDHLDRDEPRILITVSSVKALKDLCDEVTRLYLSKTTFQIFLVFFFAPREVVF